MFAIKVLKSWSGFLRKWDNFIWLSILPLNFRREGHNFHTEQLLHFKNHLNQPSYSTCVTGPLADWLSCLNLRELVKCISFQDVMLCLEACYWQSLCFFYMFSCTQIKGKSMFLIPQHFCKSPNWRATNLAVGAALSLLIIKINGETSLWPRQQPRLLMKSFMGKV